MELLEHLKEFRDRVLWATLFLFIGTVIGFVWYEVSVGPVPSLGHLLIEPYCSVPPESRAEFAGTTDCRLLATAPFEQFMLRLKVGAFVGVILSSPFWIYQVWAFIAPGLHRQEKKWTILFVGALSTLFVSGAVVAYFVVSKALGFLLTVGDAAQVTALSGAEYFSFVLTLIVIFGLSFELPLIIVVLNILGIVSYTQLNGARRVLIVILFAFAAVATPGQDPFSMIALALSLTVLQEIAIQITRLNDRRRRKARPEWLDAGEVDDESAAPIAAATPIGVEGVEASSAAVTASPREAPTPIASSAPEAPVPVTPSRLSAVEALTGDTRELPPPHAEPLERPQPPRTRFDDIL